MGLWNSSMTCNCFLWSMWSGAWRWVVNHGLSVWKGDRSGPCGLLQLVFLASEGYFPLNKYGVSALKRQRNGCFGSGSLALCCCYEDDFVFPYTPPNVRKTSPLVLIHGTTKRHSPSAFVSKANIELPLGKWFMPPRSSHLEDRHCLSGEAAGDESHASRDSCVPAHERGFQ